MGEHSSFPSTSDHRIQWNPGARRKKAEKGKRKERMQVSTIAGWSFVFYRTWDNTSLVALAFFLIIIIFATYVLINLFLAGLKLKFASASHDALAAPVDTSAGEVRVIVTPRCT
jgi:hypothetical protein